MGVLELEHGVQRESEVKGKRVCECKDAEKDKYKIGGKNEVKWERKSEAEKLKERRGPVVKPLPSHFLLHTSPKNK
jgi:hypothetical protein